MSEGIDAEAIASNIPPEPAAAAPSAPEPEPAVTETPKAVETQAEQPQTEQQPQEDPDFVRRFNALARKEREMLQREQQIKERHQEFENYQKERAKLKDNPLDFLESNGWKFQDLADYVLNNNQATPETQVSRLQKRLDDMEAERKAEIESREKAEQQAKNEEQLTAFKNSIKETVSTKSEQYELVNEYGEYETVYDVIANYYNEHGVILDTDKAAAEVEKYLEDRLTKAANTQKFRRRYSPIEQAIADAAERKEELRPQDTGLSTLTNESVSQAPAQPKDESGYLSEEESKAKSAEILREWIMKKKGYTKT